LDFGNSSDGLLDESLALGGEGGVLPADVLDEELLEDEDDGGVAAPEPDDGVLEAGAFTPDGVPASATGSDE
jgi:hypothetical protein